MEEQKKNPAQGLSESEQVQVRRQKLADLQAAGRDPFTLTKFPQDAYSADLKEEFKDLPNETDSGKQEKLVDWLACDVNSDSLNGVYVDDSGKVCAILRDSTGSYGYYAEQSALGIDEDSGALIAINGDYCNNQTSGFLVRNGELYFSEQTSNDICVLYKDGTMATYAPDEYVVEDELQKNVYQVWKFGPKLLDADGVPMTTFNTSSPIKWENPRSAIGYYEPGHYCFVVVDGRQDGYSRGLKIEELAKLFADLGCKAAYNLDGGASAGMTFNSGRER